MSNSPSRDLTQTQTLIESTDHMHRAPFSSRTALIVKSRTGVEVLLLTESEPIVMGRAPTSGVRIDDGSLSREHARFALITEGRVEVRDLGSKNGTYRNRERIVTAELEVGDEVKLGGVRVQVQALGATGGSLGIVGEAALRRHVEHEFSRAQQFRRPFALLLARFYRGADAVRPELARPWLETVRQRIRTFDHISLHGRDAIDVLLPETGADVAFAIAQALAQPIPETDVHMHVGIASYPAAGSTIDALFEACREASRQATPTEPVMNAGTSLRPLPLATERSRDFVMGNAMQPIVEAIDRVARSRIPVILHGETGTGKEVLATRIHALSPRKDARLVRVNCGTLPKDLVESTLFGHERGAFTGAVQQQRGIFEEAHEGTVFLDEIGELPLPAQVALLRVLETGTFCRVGSNRELKTDTRIVAATHRDLEALVEEGLFRADLYYRLSGVVLEIPPLRERLDEIEPLARRFLAKAAQADGCHVEGLLPETIERLLAYSWPGNVRELKNAIERAVVVTRTALLAPSDLPARIRAATEEASGERAVDPEFIADSPAPRQDESVTESKARTKSRPIAARTEVHDYEEKMVRSALEAANWNRAQAALQLGMPVRTLSYRMKVLGIQKPSG